jgi:hypothetical protein
MNFTIYTINTNGFIWILSGFERTTTTSIYTSYDAINWEAQTVPDIPSAKYTWRSFAWNGTYWVAMSERYDIIYSLDSFGINWRLASRMPTLPDGITTSNMPSLFNSASLIFNGVYYVICAATTTSYPILGTTYLCTSIDGINWGKFNIAPMRLMNTSINSSNQIATNIATQTPLPYINILGRSPPGPTGGTGLTGSTGMTGAPGITGPTGPASIVVYRPATMMSGPFTRAINNTSPTNGCPILTTGLGPYYPGTLTTAYLISFNVNFTGWGYNTRFTIGRSATAASNNFTTISAASTNAGSVFNIVNNILMTQSGGTPSMTNTSYIAATSVILGDLGCVSGSIIDIPCNGSTLPGQPCYYNIWVQTDAPNITGGAIFYATMNIVRVAL